MKPQVLIVGAGPTGLALALGLEKRRVPFRIIDKNKGPGEASRAIAVQARTLELYQQFGIAEQMVHSGIVINQLQIYKENKLRAKVHLNDVGNGLSPFPYVLSLPQDEHEQILANELEAKGVSIEWNTELVSFRQEKDYVHAVISKQGETEESDYAYLCGCDGAHSPVRKGIGLHFEGGTYKQVFYVADVRSTIPVDELRIHLYEGGFGLTVPVRTSGSVRLISLVPEELSDQLDNLDFDRIAPYAEKHLGVSVSDVNWFSTYKIHHRVSERFRQGRVLIAGDAGHVHSPAGGQGMNTGIGDALNLAWKLAAVIHGKADEAILDSYETERLAFAKSLVSTTDRLFTSVVGEGGLSKLVREVFIPYLIPPMTGMSLVKKTLFRIISQTRIHYRDSILSQGTAGSIHGGDRLPWVPLGGGDNYKPLQSFDWQYHVYGRAKSALRELAQSFAIPLFEFEWTGAMKEKGIDQDSVFLIRPDGYVALADAGHDIEKMRPYLLQFVDRKAREIK